MKVPDQNQHRVSQVYLREFGYYEDGIWKICHLQPSNKMITCESIDKIVSGTNIFDLPYNTLREIRHYETQFGKIETQYHKVVKGIKNQKQLVGKQRDILNHFIASLISRSEFYENVINGFFESEELTNSFLDEIMMVEGDEYLESNFPKEYYLRCINELEGREKYNSVLGQFMNSLVWRLRSFSSLVIEIEDGAEWYTSDNPVFIDLNHDGSLIITFNSEIYFPISRDYLVYMWNKNSEEKSELKELKEDKINLLDAERAFQLIAKKYLTNPCKHVFFGKDTDVYEQIEMYKG